MKALRRALKEKPVKKPVKKQEFIGRFEKYPAKLKLLEEKWE